MLHAFLESTTFNKQSARSLRTGSFFEGRKSKNQWQLSGSENSAKIEMLLECIKLIFYI